MFHSVFITWLQLTRKKRKKRTNIYNGVDDDPQGIASSAVLQSFIHMVIQGYGIYVIERIQRVVCRCKGNLDSNGTEMVLRQLYH
ncbi:hypothetical protein V1477_005754 [Vespula maculifrons]|uniref:Uncharacterized protein n=1 Tax=Vespula maculifrons TaxID=7453 RepID=A0ABD2CLW8_VESMC